MNSELEKIDIKMDKLLDRIHELDKKVVAQDHLTHRIANLERNQYFIIVTFIGGAIKMIVDFFQGR
jgi:hypothetical protein